MKKKYLFFIYIITQINFFACKVSDEIDVYFIDASNRETTKTYYSSRPFVSYKPVFELQNDATYKMVGLETVSKLYSFMGVRIVVENTSDNDYSLVKINFVGTAYGPTGGTSPLQFEGVTDGCKFEEIDCQFCYPRRIPPGSQEFLQVSKGPLGDNGCYWGFRDDTSNFIAAKLRLDATFHSEEHGIINKKIEIFAEPKSGYSPMASGKFGYLYCSDGKNTNSPSCGGPWEWGDDPGTGTWAECNCDDLCVCEDEGDD